MITEITIKNFKSLKNIKSKLNSLNILTGLNGVGKSSFLQSLLLIMQSTKLEKGIIELRGHLTDIGVGRDALYQFAQSDKIVFELTMNDNQYLWECNYQKDADFLEAKNNYLSNQITMLQKAAEQFHYINSIRHGPSDIYPISSDVSDEKQIGARGEYAPYYINLFGNNYIVPETLRHEKATSETLLSQINAWMKEISPGVSLQTEFIPSINIVTLHCQFDYGNNKTNKFLPKNVGSGISYVIPVILILLTAVEGKTIIIENPESHIHPRGQVEIGKLIALAAQNGAQVFVETHSDHVLNGIRVAVKENKVDKEKVNILFFDKETTETEQYAKITSIKIDKNGSLSNYPDNFMDEWSNQLSKLI
jgi:predicted ATPase